MIEMQNISFSYSKKQKLIDGFSLQLTTGNIYGLLGRNGAGKTTLLKLMVGMLFPKSGKCCINGNLSSKRLPEILQDIFFVPEDFELQGKTVREFAEIHGKFYPKFSYPEFTEYLHTFGIVPGNVLKSLSFGQKKQVLLSFGLAVNTKYLILDEPTNALDIPSKEILRRMLTSAINENRSFIISTHQIRDLSNLLDPIIIIDKGKVIFNKDYNQIGNKLAFKTLKSIDNNENILWYEKRFTMYDTICVNTSNEHTNTDIESLFKAVTADNNVFDGVF
jgi:ABC-2 type transport system ATP-binding protein